MKLVSGSCVLDKEKGNDLTPCQMKKVFNANFNQKFLSEISGLEKYQEEPQVMKGYLLLSPEMVYPTRDQIIGKKISKISCRVSVCCQENFVANIAFVGPEFLTENIMRQDISDELRFSFLKYTELGAEYDPSMVFSRGSISGLDQNALSVNINSLSQPIPIVELSGTFPIKTVDENNITDGTSSTAISKSHINAIHFIASTYTIAGAVLIQVFVPKNITAVVNVKAELGIELS